MKASFTDNKLIEILILPYQTLKESMEREKVKGFVKVMVSSDVTEGLNILYVSVILRIDSTDNNTYALVLRY